MSGIIFFGMMGVWVFISVKLTGLLTKIVKSPRKKSWVYPPVFILIFVTPIMDEIIGGFQFRALCKPENMLVYDAEKVRGKTVEYKGVSGHTIYRIIPIRVTESYWVEPNTENILIKRLRYTARAGWLGRLFGFSSILNGSCGANKKSDQLFQELNIVKIEK